MKSELDVDAGNPAGINDRPSIHRRMYHWPAV
jgi:hypothetical protein